MPSLNTLPARDGGSFVIWNLERRVGFGAVLHGLDVKLVQYLLFKRAVRNKTSEMTRTDVDGIWGPKSNAALKGLESSNPALTVQDGVVDPMLPGQIIGPIHSLTYKIFNLQLVFLTLATGFSIQTLLHDGISDSTIQDIILSLPDNDDVPGDLKSKLIDIRDNR